MTRAAAIVGVITLLVSASLAGQQPAPAGQQPVTPGGRSAGPGGAPRPPATPQAPAAAAPAVPRTFSAPVGLLFNTVRADRVADFEKVIAYLQQAFMKTTDANVQAQAKSWRVFKAAEAGPNGTVMYVFVLDPTVPGADYSLGRILADAYPETAQLQEIWKLYTSSITGGGSLLNLSPVSPDPEILTKPASGSSPTAPATTPQAPPGERAR